MLKRLKELEGEMGLGDSDSDSSGSDTSNKRKREMMDMQARKKWKGHEPRLCNLFLQGKCPRVSDFFLDILFKIRPQCSDKNFCMA